MPMRLILLFLGLASPAVAGTLLLGHPLAEVAFSILAALFPVALMALGAVRDGRLGRQGLVFVILAVILVVGVGGMLHVRGRVGELPWVGGLPLAAALQVYLVFCAPLLLVGLAYAFSFDRHTLRREDLEALRRPPAGSGERAPPRGEA